MLKPQGVSVADFLNYILQQRRRANSRSSLRSFATKTGVPVSSLSKVLASKKKLSPFDAHKIILAAKLTKPESEAFLNQVFFECKEAEPDQFTSPSSAGTDAYFSDLNKISALMCETEVYQTFVYQMKNELTQRSLVRLKNKKDGSLSEHFFDVYVNINREVAGPGYFLKAPNGAYENITSTEVSRFTDNRPIKNPSLEVHFDDEGFPSIRGMSLIYDRGPMNYKADLIYSKSKCELIGGLYDNHGRLIRKIHDLYFRISPSGSIG